MKIITAKQMRERYDIPTATESLLRKEGRLPYIKKGRNVFYDQDQLDRIAREGTLTQAAFIAISNIDAGNHDG